MELKKNTRYDLERKRPIFFGIGLIVSLLLTISAFEWRTEIDPIIQFVIIDEPYEPFLPPVTTNPPPPPPPPKEIIIKTVEDDEPVEDPPVKIDIQVKEDPPEVFIPPSIPDEVPDEAPINYAEIMPSYKGGMENFYVFLSKNIRYPRQAVNMKIEGKVFVQFVVEKDGTLSDIKVVKGIGAGCDKEALRVMKIVEGFTPGKQRDVRVRVQMVIPIIFKLH